MSNLKSIDKLPMLQFPCTILPITTLVPHQKHCHPPNEIVSQSIFSNPWPCIRLIGYGNETNNAYKHIRVSFIINTACLLHVLAILATILREMHYKGYHRFDTVTCDLSYIGQTCHSLGHRYKEHIRYITSNNPNLHTHSTLATVPT